MDQTSLEQIYASLSIGKIVDPNDPKNPARWQYIIPHYRIKTVAIDEYREATTKATLTNLQKIENQVTKQTLPKRPKGYYRRRKIRPDRLHWGRMCHVLRHQKDGKTYNVWSDKAKTQSHCLLCKDSFTGITIDTVEDFANGRVTRLDLGL